MEMGAGVTGTDVPIDKLVPLNERQAHKSGYRKILSSMKAVGLIEPLCVYPEKGHYVILDGYLRYQAALQLGITNVPCMCFATKEAYTTNRRVNHLSQVQESRMLNQSLDTLEEDTIASALGLAGIRHKLKRSLLKQLHPRVVEVFDRRSIPLRTCADEFTFVKPDYQVIVLKEMEKTGDFSAAHARMLILRAPDDMKNEKRKHSTPWTRSREQRSALATKLEEAEQRHEFYSNVYRQYVADLLVMCVYVRKVMSSKRIGAYVKSHEPELFARFNEILFETEGRRAT